MPIYFPTLFSIFGSFGEQSVLIFFAERGEVDRVRWQNTVINHRHFVEVAQFFPDTDLAQQQQHKQQQLLQRLDPRHQQKVF